MARCGCSGQVCTCLVIAGDNITVTGSGSPTNPYVINAVLSPFTEVDTDTVDLTFDGTNLQADVKIDAANNDLIQVGPNGLSVSCEDVIACVSATPVTVAPLDTNTVDMVVTGGPAYVVSANVKIDPAGIIPTTPGPAGILLECNDLYPCFSGINGVAFNGATGEISAVADPALGNTLTVSPAGLFVPAGSNAVTAGCGLLGTGLVGDPLVANTAIWPFACPQTANQTGVFCDPATGLLGGPPEKFTVYDIVRHASFTGTRAPGGVNTLPVLVPIGPTVPTLQTPTATLNITNPSDCLPMTLRVRYGIEHAQIRFSDTGGAGGNGDRATTIEPTMTTGGSIGVAVFQSGNAHQDWRHDGQIDAGDNIIVDSSHTEHVLTFTLAPGASASFDIQTAIAIPFLNGTGQITYTTVSSYVDVLGFN